jgi:hypothetical protein
MTCIREGDNRVTMDPVRLLLQHRSNVERRGAQTSRTSTRLRQRCRRLFVSFGEGLDDEMGNAGVSFVNRSRPQAVGFWYVSCTIDNIGPGLEGASHDVFVRRELMSGCAAVRSGSVR